MRPLDIMRKSSLQLWLTLRTNKVVPISSSKQLVSIPSVLFLFYINLYNEPANPTCALALKCSVLNLLLNKQTPHCHIKPHDDSSLTAYHFLLVPNLSPTHSFQAPHLLVSSSQKTKENSSIITKQSFATTHNKLHHPVIETVPPLSVHKRHQGHSWSKSCFLKWPKSRDPIKLVSNPITTQGTRQSLMFKFPLQLIPTVGTSIWHPKTQSQQVQTCLEQNLRNNVALHPAGSCTSHLPPQFCITCNLHISILTEFCPTNFDIDLDNFKAGNL